MLSVRRAWGVWLAGLFWLGSAQAFEVGRIRVESVLGEPLAAVIPITEATGAELQQLQLNVGSEAAYQLLQLTRRPALESLTLTLQQDGALPHIRVQSAEAISDPHLDLLVEMRWNAGRVLREYVLLIEPRRVAEVTPALLPTVAGNAAFADGRYGPVRAGESVTRIARRWELAATQPSQRALALYSQNPHAFIANDINRLQQGSQLILPAAAAVQAVPAPVALAQLKALMAATPYPGQAGEVEANPNAATETPSQGYLAPAPADATALMPHDAVRISRGGEGSAQALEEEIAARTRALKEAEARIAALEQTVLQLQTVLEKREAGQGRVAGQLKAVVDVLASPQFLGLLAIVVVPLLFWTGLRFERRRHEQMLATLLAAQSARVPETHPSASTFGTAESFAHPVFTGGLPGLSGLSLDLEAAPSAAEELSVARAHLTLGDRVAARQVLETIVAQPAHPERAEAQRLLASLAV